jgi:hypothetical protein
MVNLALTLPMVDVDRMTPTNPNGTKISVRARLAIAFAVFVAVWLVARLNGYWLP